MSELTGTLALLRLALRRDRILIPVSALALTALSVGSAQATVNLYPNVETARRGLSSVLTSTSSLALYGPASTKTLEGMSIFKTSLMGAVFVGLLAYAVVRRHTRVEEEEGRLELIQAGVVGRRAPLTAAVTLALMAVALTALLSVIGLIGIGFDATGSMAFGAAWAVAGLFMTGVTAVAAQLTSSARGCATWALSVLGAAYLVRAAGDGSGTDWLSWASPLGWPVRLSPYDANRFWVLGLGLALTAALVATAYLLLGRRDLGAGLLASRPGPARGGATMRSTQGLIWRLGRPTVLGWTIAYAVLGTVVGALSASVLDMMDDPAVVGMLRKLGGSAGTLIDIYLSTEMRITAVGAAAAGIALALRLPAEERSGRAEAVLATATSRARWYLSHAGLAWALSAWLMLLVAAVEGVTAARSTAGAPPVGEVVLAGVATLPAVWVSVGVALLLAGLANRFAVYAWAVLAVLFALGEFGSVLSLPDWLVKVSPFAHISQLPGGQFEAVPFVVLLVIAVALGAVGLGGYRRRDAA